MGGQFLENLHTDIWQNQINDILEIVMHSEDTESWNTKLQPSLRDCQVLL